MKFLIIFVVALVAYATAQNCPNPNGNFAVHLPHADCTKFYKCDKGVPGEH